MANETALQTRFRGTMRAAVRRFGAEEELPEAAEGEALLTGIEELALPARHEAAADRKAFVADGTTANRGVWRRNFSDYAPILDLPIARSSNRPSSESPAA